MAGRLLGRMGDVMSLGETKQFPLKVARVEFPLGTVVSSPSLIVDIHGNAWWVDPELKSVFRADLLIPNPNRE